MDTVDLLGGRFVRRTRKSRTNSANEMVPCGVWQALGEGGDKGGWWLLPASPGEWAEAATPAAIAVGLSPAMACHSQVGSQHSSGTGTAPVRCVTRLRPNQPKWALMSLKHMPKGVRSSFPHEWPQIETHLNPRQQEDGKINGCIPTMGFFLAMKINKPPTQVTHE